MNNETDKLLQEKSVLKQMENQQQKFLNRMLTDAEKDLLLERLFEYSIKSLSQYIKVREGKK